MSDFIRVKLKDGERVEVINEAKYLISKDNIKRLLHNQECLGCGLRFESVKQGKYHDFKCFINHTQNKRYNNGLLFHYEKGDNYSTVELFSKSGFRYTISNIDLNSILRFNWTNDKDGYLISSYFSNDQKVNIKLHRFIMLNDRLYKSKDIIIDHIDGDPTNNTRSNLRITNRIVNGLNRHKSKYKYPNVYPCGEKFKARISFTSNGKKKYISKVFERESEANEWVVATKKEIINEL